MSEKKRLIILLLVLAVQIGFILFTRYMYQQAFN